MSSLFPTYPKGLITPVKGKGSWLYDEEGNSYLDFTSGIGVCQLGHVPDKVKRALHNQIDLLWHTSNIFANPLQEELAEKLTDLSGLNYAFFANSGAEANEAAIKLARRYHQKVKNNGRFEIITFESSFHGRTLATLTATGQDKVKVGFNPLPEGFVSIPYGDLEVLNNTISEKTAAIMLEVVQGEGGINPVEIEWLKEVEKISKEKDILLIIDEIQTGIGRTGEWFGFQNYSIKPDIITLAKGLGNGFPIGAILGTEETKEAFNLGSHGSTFGGNFLATSTSIATIKMIEEDDVLNNVKKMSTILFNYINTKLAKYSDLVEIRGYGLMVGIEWDKPVNELLNICKDNGLLVLTAGQNVIRLLPPLNISKEELVQGLNILDKSVNSWL